MQHARANFVQNWKTVVFPPMRRLILSGRYLGVVNPNLWFSFEKQTHLTDILVDLSGDFPMKTFPVLVSIVVPVCVF